MGPANQSINYVRLRREKREEEKMFVARNVDIQALIQALAAAMVTAVAEAHR